jgi:hypothetical protein
MMGSMTRRAPPRSATISAGGAPGVPLKNAACSLRTERATTHSLERPPLWPDLPRPRMAGFEVSTEGRIATRINAATLRNRHIATRPFFLLIEAEFQWHSTGILLLGCLRPRPR